jgi:hypothetical protein
MTKRSVLRFHQATHTFLKDETLNAVGMSRLVEQLRGIDAMQKYIYFERTAPLRTPLLKKLQRLFGREAYLHYAQAKNIRLVDGVLPEPESPEALADYLLSRETDASLNALRASNKRMQT